jgi:hypothetical protein
MSSLPKPHCVAALVLAVLSLAASRPASGGATTGSPLSVLSAFEQAWSEGRVDLLEKTLAAERIAMSLSHAGPQDEAYTRTQAAYLIKDALAYRITESFEFVEFHWSEAGSAMPSGTARWEFRRSEGEPVRELLLRVTLRKEGPTWAVAEIRVLPSR